MYDTSFIDRATNLIDIGLVSALETDFIQLFNSNLIYQHVYVADYPCSNITLLK